jgi:hypothetical protein
MEKKQKINFIEIGKIQHLTDQYSVETEIYIKQREFLSIVLSQELKDINGNVQVEMIVIEQGNFSEFLLFIEKALWRCLDIEANAAIKLDPNAAN